MESLQQFRTLVSSQQSERIFAELVRKQEAGEIRTESQLRLELQRQLTEINARGQITFQIPVRPWDNITSSKFRTFFNNLKLDIDVLFEEVDHTESVLNGLADLIAIQIRTLKFAVGQVRAAAIQEKLQAQPGSGFNKVVRDSFDRGYSRLAGRAETPYDLFRDTTGSSIERGEATPIKADARIDSITKKLILPSSREVEVGFKHIEILNEPDTTPNELPIRTRYPEIRAIDRQDDTFWSLTVGRNYPAFSEVGSSVSQIAGPTSELEPIVDISGLVDTRRQNYYLRVVNISGNNPQYVSMPVPDAFIGPWFDPTTDQASSSEFRKYYRVNCGVSEEDDCRLEARSFVSGVGAIQDGFNVDTNINLVFPNDQVSGLEVGQTWRVTVEPSGTVGAVARAELWLTQPSNINWIELDPVVDTPFDITSVEYTKPGSDTRLPITSGRVIVQDTVRFDFAKIEAEKIYFTFNQKSYIQRELDLTEQKIALGEIEDIRLADKTPSVDEVFDVNINSLLSNELRSPESRDILGIDNNPELTPRNKIEGYFYQLGVFDINCGLTQYSEQAIAVTTENRCVTPRLFGLQANLEPQISYAVSGATNGTFEFSLVKLNFDSNNELINIQDFSVPVLNSGVIRERLVVDSRREGTLRFAASSIQDVNVITLARTLTSGEYRTAEIEGTVPQTQIAINRSDVSSDNTIVVEYTPRYGVYLDEDQTLVLESNTAKELSLANVDAVVTSRGVIKNRDVAFSDLHLRIILRRNDHDSSKTPGLRDYQLLIGEADDGRFFV